MKFKCVLFFIFITLPVLSSFQAATSGYIDNVRRKSVLNDQDKQIIDDFIRESIDDLVNENDFSNIARRRDAITSRKDSQQVQYDNQFKESTLNYITKAFEKARNIKQEKNRAIIVTNLLILINKLENVQLAILAKNKLDDKNAMVRYWAVSCIVNPQVINQLNSGEASNPGLPKEITTKFISIVSKSSPETLSMMAGFAAGINIPEGQELLLKIADQRIADYSEWSVKQEYEDENILIALESVINKASNNSNIQAAAQRFAQLYSYVIQRYAKAGDFLSVRQKAQLKTVIIETESKCIRNMTGAQQDLKIALEEKLMQKLIDEHDKLLGSNVSQGKLPAKYNFNYGQDENGSTRNSPAILSDPE